MFENGVSEEGWPAAKFIFCQDPTVLCGMYRVARTLLDRDQDSKTRAGYSWKRENQVHRLCTINKREEVCLELRSLEFATRVGVHCYQC